MDLWDRIFGTFPGSWTGSQIDAFSKAYNSMVQGVFGWTDFIPPMNLAGAGGAMMQLSIKALVHFGNKGTTALDVEKVHEKLLAGATPNDILEENRYTKFKRPATGLNEVQVFYVILVLESVVYGNASAWNKRRR